MMTLSPSILWPVLVLAMSTVSDNVVDVINHLKDTLPVLSLFAVSFREQMIEVSYRDQGQRWRWGSALLY